MTTNESVLQTQGDLNWVVSELDDIIGIDTEFHRRRTFFPQPCLLQLATSKGAYIVDLLSPLNLAGLESKLFSNENVKVTHSPREDLELLYVVFGAKLPNLIDVQLAHSFVSSDAALSYSALVDFYLKFQLKKNKKLTQSDWRSRPLTRTQVDYALDDVRFLIPLWDQIRCRLRELDRLSWFLEEMQHYFLPVYEFSLGEIAAFSTHLDWNPIDLRVYFGILEWRERTARSRNVPRERVLSNKTVRSAVECHDKSVDFFKERFQDSGRKLHRLIYRIKLTTSQTNTLHFLHESSFGQSPEKEELFRKTKEPIRQLVLQKSNSLNLALDTLGRSSRISSWISYYDEHQQFPPTFGTWREKILGTELREILNS